MIEDSEPKNEEADVCMERRAFAVLRG